MASESPQRALWAHPPPRAPQAPWVPLGRSSRSILPETGFGGRSSRRGLTRVSVRGTNGQLWYHFGTRERGCLKRPGRPKNPRKGLLKDAWKTPYLRKGLFEEAWKAQNLRKELLKDGCMASFGTILNHCRPKTTQMLQMVRFGCILQYFGPKAFLSKEPSTRNGLPSGTPF